jgi:hypothetical protein
VVRMEENGTASESAKNQRGTVVGGSRRTKTASRRSRP